MQTVTLAVHARWHNCLAPSSCGSRLSLLGILLSEGPYELAHMSSCLSAIAATGLALDASMCCEKRGPAKEVAAMTASALFPPERSASHRPASELSKLSAGPLEGWAYVSGIWLSLLTFTAGCSIFGLSAVSPCVLCLLFLRKSVLQVLAVGACLADSLLRRRSS